MPYKAFISYSHAVDGKLAPALESALKSFARPWYALRAMRVFRDKTSLAANPGLWSSITAALESSEFFILLASPPAAQSPWVRQEVEWWLGHRSPDTLLIVVTDGGIAWDRAAGRFSARETTAIPPVLLDRFKEEPLYVDLRWARSQDNLSLRHTQFRAAVLDLAATLHGQPKDDLDGEDVRQHRRFRLAARSAIAGLVVLTIAAVAGAIMAVTQARIAEERRLQAEREREIALSRQLVAQSELLRERRAHLLPTSALLAAESLQRHFSVEGVTALQKALALIAQRTETRLPHPAAVVSVGLDGDGGLAVTAAEDNIARVWNLETGTETVKVAFSTDALLRVTAAGGTVAFCAAFGREIVVVDPAQGVELYRLQTDSPVTEIVLSPDGSALAIGESGGALTVWDIAGNRERWHMLLGGGVEAVAFSPDGQRLASGSRDNAARIWDAASGKQIRAISHPSAVHAVAFSPDGSRLAVGTWDSGGRLWDSATGRLVATLNHKAVVTMLAFSQDGQFLASASDDGTAKLWNARGEQLARFAPEGGVLGVALSPDGRLLATRGLGQSTHLWDSSGRELARTVLPSLPESLAFGSKGEVLVSGVDGTFAEIRRLRADPAGGPLHHGQRFWAASFPATGTRFAAAYSDGTIRVADTATGSELARIDAPGRMSILHLSPAGDRLAALGADGYSLPVWSVQEPPRLLFSRKKEPTPPWFHDMIFTGDGRHLALDLSQARDLPLLDAATGKEGARLAHGALIQSFDADFSGTRMVTAGGRSVVLWEIPGGRRLRAFEQSDDVIAVKFSPAGGQVAFAGKGGAFGIIDLERGATTLSSRLDGDDALALAFTADGRLLAVSGAATTGIWNVASGTRQATMTHEGPVEFLSFTPDGRHLAAGSRDHSAYIWESAGGAEAARISHPRETFRVAFSADGKFLVAQSFEEDGTSSFAQAWLWRPGDLIAETCRRTGRSLTQDEWRAYLPGQEYRERCAEPGAGRPPNAREQLPVPRGAAAP